MRNLSITKKVLSLGSMLVMTLVIFTSCQKEIPNDFDVLQSETTQSIQDVDEKPVSLMEMAELLPTRKDFLSNTVPTDNSFLDDGFGYKSSGPTIHFKWRFACDSKFPGICVIVYFENVNEDEDLVSASLEVIDDKLQITPSTLDDVFSEDGYLPITENVELPSKLVKQLGFESLTIKSGIYKATFNQETQQYENVIVDVE